MTPKASGNDSDSINQELLSILACPTCDARSPVELTSEKKFLKCVHCGLKYPINNGIPVMLVEEAVPDTHQQQGCHLN